MAYAIKITLYRCSDHATDEDVLCEDADAELYELETSVVLYDTIGAAATVYEKIS